MIDALWWEEREGADASGRVMQLVADLNGPRDRYLAFIARHDIAWELLMAALAVVYVAVGFAVDDASEGARPVLEALELSLTLVFAA